MSLTHRSKLEIKLGDYAVGQANSLVDPLLVTRAQDYKRFTASRMIPLEAGDIRKRLPPGEYHVSLKVDGEFSVLVYADGEAITVNPGGTVRAGLPVLTEAANLLKAAGIKKALFAGELHCVRPDGKRARVHDVSRIARQPGSKAELDSLNLAVFDIIEIDSLAPSGTFRQTWQKLNELFAKGKRINVVEALWIKDVAEVEKQFRHWVDSGAEGAVVRSEAAGMYKIKPRHNLDAVVIGFTEGSDDRRGMIHDLLLAVMRADGCLHVLGHVGGGFTEADRREFLSDLKDTIAGSDYVEVNDQVAYHMVRPETVIEISVLDMIAQTTRGMPINKMALHWNPSEKRYQIVRRLPLVGLISPQFIRRREDKSVNAVDIRIKQVTDLVEVPLADRDARQLNLAHSKVLRREVYTKQLKGATMVRKLVMWETNKANESEDFPAFVIHFTDFSPNRKAPLERDIRVSSSREQIDGLWGELIAENISKGWNPAGAAPPEPPAKPAPKKRGKAEKEETKEPAAAEETAVEAPAKKRAPRKKS